ncbi:MAG: ATPase [Acidobacteria bacterium]|nr:ATPase [Acidobacteriota bacterium]
MIRYRELPARRPAGGDASPRASFLRGFLSLLPAVLAFVAFAAFIAGAGFPLTTDDRERLAGTTRGLLVAFVAITLARAALSAHRRYFLRAHAPDAALVLVVFLLQTLPGSLPGASELGSLRTVLTQGLPLLVFLPGILRSSRRLLSSRLPPSLLVLASFVILVISGAGLLLLPRATTSPLSAVDALFMAASAACVTGLAVVDPATAFTPLGKVILLVLIQAGGLGIMTLTTFLGLFLGGGRSLRHDAALQELVGEESFGRLRRVVATIGLATFALEGAGAMLLYRFREFPAEMRETSRIFESVFHAVSSFCNAGFALHSSNLAAEPFAANTGYQLVVMALITIGGLGFPVLSGLAGFAAARVRPGQPRRRLPLHVRLVLATSLVLTVGGGSLVYLLERDAALGPLSGAQQVLAAAFHSVSCRTAGFNTVDMAELSRPGVLVSIFLMWIGGSPASTAGGIKTTTLAIALLSVRATVHGMTKVEVFRREVAPNCVVKAFGTVLLSIVALGLGFFSLLLSERHEALPLLFETVSALSTVGLSMGVTPGLTDPGKLVVTLLMLVGRVGLLGTLVALTRPPGPRFGYDYVDEDILVA